MSISQTVKDFRFASGLTSESLAASAPIAEALEQARERLGAALLGNEPARERAQLCAELLATVWPHAVCTCELEGETVSLGPDGPLPHEPELSDEALRLTASLDLPHEPLGRFTIQCTTLAPEDDLRLQLLAREACCACLARRLAAAENALADSAADLDGLTRLGELSGPVTHEFNNFLNTLLLQVAVLDMTAPESIRGDLDIIRTRGKAIAGLVKMLQQYRREHRPSFEPHDLNAIVRRAASDRELLRLEEHLPLVAGHAPELARLVQFLLAGAEALSDSRIAVTTSTEGPHVLLTIEPMEGSDRERFARVAEGPGIPLTEPSALELAACHSIARRLGGSLRTDTAAVMIELPRA